MDSSYESCYRRSDRMENQKIELSSLSDLGNDLMEMQTQLKEHADAGEVFSYQGMSADAKLVDMICDQILDLWREHLKSCQKEEIKKALEKKKEGNGRYGRPKAVLPEDFNEKIREYIEQGKNLSEYCEALHMANSTFYRYANAVMKQMNDD